MNQQETLEDGARRTTIPLTPLELRCVALATRVFEQEEEACRQILEATHARHTAARGEHRKQLDFLLLQRGIRIPEGARVRADFESESIVWEEPPEALAPITKMPAARVEALQEAHPPEPSQDVIKSLGLEPPAEAFLRREVRKMAEEQEVYREMAHVEEARSIAHEMEEPDDV